MASGHYWPPRISFVFFLASHRFSRGRNKITWEGGMVAKLWLTSVNYGDNSRGQEWNEISSDQLVSDQQAVVNKVALKWRLTSLLVDKVKWTSLHWPVLPFFLVVDNVKWTPLVQFYLCSFLSTMSNGFVLGSRLSNFLLDDNVKWCCVLYFWPTRVSIFMHFILYSWPTIVDIFMHFVLYFWLTRANHRPAAGGLRQIWGVSWSNQLILKAWLYLIIYHVFLLYILYIANVESKTYQEMQNCTGW